jgi:hypothetical protein
MGRPRKEQPVIETTESAAPVEVSGKVKILSQRPGDIIAKGGITIKFNDIVELDLDVAVNLEKMHPGLIRIL